MALTLADVYGRTHYEVLAPGESFILRIGQHSAALAKLHDRVGCRCSTFMTALNPRSQRVSEAENQRAYAWLLLTLERLGLKHLDGRASDPTEAWPDERSLLVLGSDADTARALGLEFDQSAVVQMTEDSVPALLWIHDDANRPVP